MQPVVVRPLEDGRPNSSLASGAGRAARLAGLATVPAIVRPGDDRDSLLVALVENVAREDLAGRARDAVLQDEFGLSLGDVAEHVGRSKPAVSNRLRLLDLPDDVLGLAGRGQLTEGTLAPCSRSPTTGRRLRRIVRQGIRARSQACSAAGGGEASPRLGGSRTCGRAVARSSS